MIEIIQLADTRIEELTGKVPEKYDSFRKILKIADFC